MLLLARWDFIWRGESLGLCQVKRSWIRAQRIFFCFLFLKIPRFLLKRWWVSNQILCTQGHWSPTGASYEVMAQKSVYGNRGEKANKLLLISQLTVWQNCRVLNSCFTSLGGIFSNYPVHMAQQVQCEALITAGAAVLHLGCETVLFIPPQGFTSLEAFQKPRVLPAQVCWLC